MVGICDFEPVADGIPMKTVFVCALIRNLGLEGKDLDGSHAGINDLLGFGGPCRTKESSLKYQNGGQEA